MRRLLTAVGALVSALALAACSGPATFAPPTPDDRPNILFVLTDDLSWNLVAHMPGVVQLQRDGLTMDRFHVVDSLCCPSRSSILTGRYPHDTGVFTNAGTDGGITAFDANGNRDRTFGVRLQQAGYTTGFMGKYLNGYDPRTGGIPPGWDHWAVTGPGGYREFGYLLNEDGALTRYGNAPKDYLVDVLSGKADRFIRSAARHGKPFVLEVAPFAPHDPFVPAPRYAGTKHDAYPRTPAYDAAVANAPSWLLGHAPLTPADHALIQRDWELRQEADLAVSDLIVRLRRTLAEIGQTDNTYVVFSSDNGFHMGEYRLTPGKETAYDTDVRVPLVVAGPGIAAGTTSHLLASSIDLAPTFETLSGRGPAPDVDGVSLDRVWHGRTPGRWQQGVLIEHHHRQGVPTDPDLQNARQADPPGYEAVRTKDELLVRYENGELEYYDTRTDPDELDNRAAAGVPKRLLDMLGALETCHGSAACQAAAGA